MTAASELPEPIPAAKSSDEIYRTIRQAIVSGKVDRWNRLVEEDLAKEFRVSRTPVREALRRLEHDGLVERLRRGMLVVVPITDEVRHDIHLIRVAIDQVAARLACERAAPEDWEPARAAVERLASVIEAEGIGSTAYATAHLEVHAAINRVAFRGRMSHFVSDHLASYTGIADSDYVQQLGYPPVEQHLALIAELASGDLERALAAVELHAQRGTGPGTTKGPQ